MTQLERRELYWNMYFCAEGLKKIAPEFINQYNAARLNAWECLLDMNDLILPAGFCGMIKTRSGFDMTNTTIDEISFPELMAQRPEKYKKFWFKKSDWKVRQIAILEAIKLTYEI